MSGDATGSMRAAMTYDFLTHDGEGALAEVVPVDWDDDDEEDGDEAGGSYGSVERGEGASARRAALRPFVFSWRKALAFVGPGWLMSLAYLDPGNLESDLQMGAYTGYTLLWVLFWATAGGLLLQEMAARLGVVTGESLARCVRRFYGRRVANFLYCAAELAIVGSDVQEVLGTATGLQVLFGLPLWAGCVVTAVDTCTFFLVQRLGWRALEAAVGAMVATLGFAFLAVWAGAPAEPRAVALGLVVPSMRPAMLTQAVATVGAVVMPHNLYLHSGLVQSRRVDRRKPSQVRDVLAYTFVDSALALAASFVINLAVVAAFAAFFYHANCGASTACVPRASADEGDGASCASALLADGVCSTIGLGAAAPALGAVLGPTGVLLWGVGLLAAGQASTMAATIAGQYVMEGFWDIDLAKWKRVALARALALGPAVFVAVATSHDAALQNSINEGLNVLQSAVLPFAMLPLLHLTSKPDLMGRFVTGPRLAAAARVAATVVLLVNIVLVVQYAFPGDGSRPNSPFYVAAVVLCTLAYFFAVSLAVPDWSFARRLAGPRRDPPKLKADLRDVDAFLRQEIDVRAAGRVPKLGLATPGAPTEPVCCCGQNPDATPARTSLPPE